MEDWKLVVSPPLASLCPGLTQHGPSSPDNWRAECSETHLDDRRCDVGFAQVRVVRPSGARPEWPYVGAEVVERGGDQLDEGTGNMAESAETNRPRSTGPDHFEGAWLPEVIWKQA